MADEVGETLSTCTSFFVARDAVDINMMLRHVLYGKCLALRMAQCHRQAVQYAPELHVAGFYDLGLSTAHGDKHNSNNHTTCGV